MQSKQLKPALTVAGTVIGAGFATGKELILFFKNDNISLWYLLISLIIMALVSLLYFAKQKDSKIPKSSFFVHQVIKMLFLLFSAASYTVMLACGGEALRESVSLPFFWGTVITFAITIGIVSFGVSNVYLFNLIATPILLICMSAISLAGLFSPVGMFATSQSQSVNLLMYSGYNLLSVLPVLGALSSTLEKKDGYMGICMGFLFVITVGLLLKCLLLRFCHLTQNTAIPVLSIVSYLGNHFHIFYTVMLYLSILTTAVNSFYAVTQEKNTLLIGLSLLCCSFLGFSTLIETLYPFFGYLGLGVIVYVISTAFKNQKI